MQKSAWREQLIAWGFLSPALIVLGIFGLFPIGYDFYVSLHQWRIRRAGLVGFDHYVHALGDPRALGELFVGAFLVWGGTRAFARWRQAGPARWRPGLGVLWLALGLSALWVLLRGLPELVASGDPRLYRSFKVTAFYALGTIPLELSVSLGLAFLLFRSLRGKGLFRMLFFLPYITPTVATAVVFRTLFSPHPSSLANAVWSWLGFENQRWLSESHSVAALLLQGLGISSYPWWVDDFFPSLALVSIVLYNIWVYIGYDSAILLAGLSAIPSHYYEAAALDGANAWQSLRHLTLPLISPILFLLSTLALIGTFKAFNHIYIMRAPGARDTVDVVSVLIFDQIFQYHNAGYASTLAFILFIVILVLTLLQNKLLGRRVFYGD